MAFFYPSSTRVIVVSLDNLEKKTTPTLPKGATIYETTIFAIDIPHYNHIYKESFANILCY